MTGRGRKVRRLAGKKNKELNNFDDPLEFDMDLPVKNEVCPDILPSEEEFGLVDGQVLIQEQQRLQRLYPIDMGPNDHTNMLERMSSIERKVDFLLNLNTKILARVDKICEQMKTVTPPNDFPIKDKDDLEAVDIKIANNREKYIELFKNLLTPNGIVKNIGRILAQDLLMDMNYGGISSKAGLSNYVNLNAALYESQKTEGYTFDDYKKDARMAFQKAKNRVYKSISEARKLKKLNSESNEGSRGYLDSQEGNEVKD